MKELFFELAWPADRALRFASEAARASFFRTIFLGLQTERRFLELRRPTVSWHFWRNTHLVHLVLDEQ